MLRTLVFVCIVAIVWLSIPATVGPRFQSIAMAVDTQKADGQKDRGTSSDRSGSGPLQPVRDAVKPLEKAIAEEPPKAIQNIKEGFRKRFNTTQDQSKEK